MYKKILSLFFFFAIASISFAARDVDLFGGNEGTILVNNRVLARVEEVPITVIDIKKRLDYIFAREYPQYASSPAARHEFYKVTWRAVLKEQIQKYLIKADAKEMKLEISPGEIRQSMEEQFGPDMIHNLEKVGVSYDDAAKVIEEDLQIERVVGMRIHARAIRMVTPALLHKQYEAFCDDSENIHPSLWKYRVVTLRDEKGNHMKDWAQTITSLLADNAVTLDTLPDYIAQQENFPKEAQLHISKTYTHEDHAIAKPFKEVLATLSTDSFSTPVEEKNDDEGTTIQRIFYLEEHQEERISSFEEVAQQLNNQLLQEIVSHESEKYFAKLDEVFVVQILFDDAEDYDPFVLYTA